MAYPKVDFLYLNEEDMVKAGVLDGVRCTECMEELLKLLDEGRYRMGGDNGNSHGTMISFPEAEDSKFPEMPVNGPDRRFMAMPAYVGGKFDLAGVKWYGSNVEHRDEGLPRSILMVMLNDKKTGAPIALMSANLLSAERTASIPGAGVKNLSLPDSKVLGIVGPGVINTIAIKTFGELRPSLDTLKIKGRGRASIDRCIAFVKENCPQFTNIEVVDTLEECVRGSDIVNFATSTTMGGNGSADYPFVEEDWIKPGALICVPGSANFDDEFLAKRAKLVVDNIKLYDAWEEEYGPEAFETIYIPGCKFLDMVDRGEMTRDHIDDLGAILNGKKPGRESPEQKIIYSIGGMPVEDVAWGKDIYEYAVEHGIGQKLNLWDKPMLF